MSLLAYNLYYNICTSIFHTMETSFAEKNNFIARAATAANYKGHLAYFKKVFPQHKLLPELERVTEVNRQQFHERILLTLLSVKSIPDVEKSGGVDQSASATTDPVPPAPIEPQMNWSDIKTKAKSLGISTQRKTKAVVLAEIEAREKKS